jgi:hypothetical protein
MNTMAKEVKKRRKSARVVGRGRDYWTTAAEFWQWQKQGLIVKTDDNPLTGEWVNRDARHLVLLNHVVSDRRCPTHLSVILESRKLVRAKSRRG